jgi:hypothetical protein|tara:strand:- start:226 stop:339 length:114 start_codon:yes stop_codon:yes gene_type:complete
MGSKLKTFREKKIMVDIQKELDELNKKRPGLWDKHRK